MATILQTWWNGEPCSAVRVTVIVGQSPRDTWWCADLHGQRRAAVQVTYGGRTFFIDDEDGTGWSKVTAGRGSPNVGHRGLPDASTVVETVR